MNMIISSTEYSILCTSRTDSGFHLRIPFCPNILTGYGPETLLGNPDVHPTHTTLAYLSCRRIHVHRL